ncbi:NAD(P)-dependent oxidoreductase [Ferruginivarius sediminum]|uniref:NAD(P)-dependent oxidoreductase n=1 Tax=Ferruginivarius sediminum TaxID=2661937 RepID=A0A369TAW7_9PROT|nr:NAD(P)-dependent oxidoreductase [Ferruginivarius sediminum]RDD61525.1 NAD(P)-dependent oxidoreductase [Ferruginivarius sediminum]
MARKTLKFVNVGKRMPEKRSAEMRRRDFDEIYARFDPDKASEQAGRCSQCGVPFCQVHCPVHNNIPDWLMLTAEGRLEEAYEVSQATNNFPEICGRICPQDRLCEGNCVIEQAGHGTVTIGAVESYITETAWEQGWVKPAKPRRELEAEVGIIGAGPAGLAAAEQLRRKGYQVHVYDRYDRIGGLMIYGIPNFKLEKYVVERRARLLYDAGVHFHLNFEVGRDATLEELREKHDAVLIATGVYKARDVKVPGVGLRNVFPALDYLVTSNRKGLGDDVPRFEDGTLNAEGKHVAVIGGGDTAMDCVRTAVRQGAKSVKCLYRRNRQNMPGSQREVANAEEEGVEFVWLSAPQAFLGDEAVSAVRAARVHLGVPDATGRQTPQIVKGSDYEIEADMVIKALGFDPEDLPTLFDCPALETTRWGTVKMDFRTMMTSLDGVFAAGDIARGASLVVWAIRDGRDAAEQIDGYIKAKAQGAGAGEAPAHAVAAE